MTVGLWILPILTSGGRLVVWPHVSRGRRSEVCWPLVKSSPMINDEEIGGPAQDMSSSQDTWGEVPQGYVRSTWWVTFRLIWRPACTGYECRHLEEIKIEILKERPLAKTQGVNSCPSLPMRRWIPKRKRKFLPPLSRCLPPLNRSWPSHCGDRLRMQNFLEKGEEVGYVSRFV